MIYILFKSGQVIRIAEVASAVDVGGRLRLYGKQNGVEPGPELGSYFTEYMMGWHVTDEEGGIEVLDE